MPHEVASVFVQEKNKLHTTSSWLELWEIRLSATDAIMVVGHTEGVTFGSQTYSPFPISRAEFTVDNDGSLIDTTVTISNVDRAVGVLTEQDYLRGRTVIYRLTNSALLATSTAVITERFVVGVVDISIMAATIHLGHANLLEQPFPGARYMRSRCRWVYGSTPCGYDATRSGAIADCDKTLNGDNGCVVHGDDEVTAGKPRLHPLRFGGFPSIPRGPYR